jgi:hypothetical protein
METIIPKIIQNIPEGILHTEKKKSKQNHERTDTIKTQEKKRQVFKEQH